MKQIKPSEFIKTLSCYGEYPKGLCGACLKVIDKELIHKSKLQEIKRELKKRFRYCRNNGIYIEIIDEVIPDE